jgi:predicted Rossmann-fold nucleotide-binding protein
MEAAHLGVAFSRSPDRDLDDALAVLGGIPKSRHLDELFEDGGTVKEAKLADLAMARVLPPVSLAIPTWLYGAEPTMPFATHYAKYYQNSLREEALINNSRAGIIYARGGGGTMREVFQDVELNYYAKSPDDVTPMIFFDRDDYWRKDPELDEGHPLLPSLKLDVVVANAIALGLRSAGFHKEDVERCLSTKIKFTIDLMAITNTLEAHAQASQRNLRFALASEPLHIGTLRLNRR